MKNITLIAAVGKNLELGKDGNLLWHISEDMKFFKNATIGKPIVMGINTFNSLPKMLPERKHIVLTHRDIKLNDEVTICNSMNELLNYLRNFKTEIMVIGGASVYAQMLEYADKMLLTEIDANKEADCFFPKFDKNDWSREVISSHDYEDISYKHLVYKRKGK